MIKGDGLIALTDIANCAQRLEVREHGLPTLRPRHDMIDVQGHGGVFRRAGAAHAAEATIADQDRGAQAPADLARGAGRWLRPLGKIDATATLVHESLEGTQRAVPGAEAALVGGAGEPGEAAALGELAPGRLAAELAPHIGEVLQQHGVRHVPMLRHPEARRAQRCVPRAEAARQRARAESAVRGIELGRHTAPAGRARDAAQVPDQRAVGNVAVLEAHEFYRTGQLPFYRASRANRASWS